MNPESERRLTGRSSEPLRLSSAVLPPPSPAHPLPASAVAELGVVRRHFTRPVKRKILLLVAAALAVFCVVYTFQPVQSVAYASFEPRFAAAIRSAGFQTLELASCSGEQVPLPLSIRLRQRHSNTDSGIHVTIGFPNSAEHYKLTVGGSAPFDCFVRYLDSRATVIAIRARPAQASEARSLHSTLAREFPGLTITLATNDA